jgi:hypothetical protein
MDNRYDLLPSYYYKDSEDGKLTKSVGKPLRDYKVYGNLGYVRPPIEYQEVEYIETTGTQYINTNYTPAPGDSIEMYRVKQSEGATGYQAFFSAGTGDYQLILLNTNEAAFLRNFTMPPAFVFNYLFTNDFSDILLVNNMFSVNDSNKFLLSPQGEVNTPLYLFKRADDSSYAQLTLGRFIVRDIYDNKVLDLIPCYRKSDGTIGMYDIVNEVFYTNDGSGVFLKGENVTTDDTPTNAIENVGEKITNIVDIDYIIENNPTDTTSLERVTFQDRDCLKWVMASKASALRIMQGKFKENTAYTIKVSVASSATGGAGAFDIVYTDGNYQRVEFQSYSPNFSANTFRDIIAFTDSHRTVDYIESNWASGQWVYIDIDKFVITEGINDITHIPSETSVYEIPVRTSAKNLADPLCVYRFVSNIIYITNGVSQLTYIKTDENGRRILSNYAASGWNTEDYDEKVKIFKGIFKEKTQYTISFECYGQEALNLGLFYTNGGYNVFHIPDYDGDSSAIHKVSFTSVEGNTVDSVRLFYTTGTAYIYLDTLQIEEGTQSTPYEPYAKYNIYLDEPLRRIGKYTDYIDYKNQKVVRNVGKYIFNGTEVFYNAGSGYPYAVEIRRYISNYVRSNNHPLISSHYTNIMNTQIDNVESTGTFCQHNQNWYFNHDNQDMGVEAFKNFLKAEYDAGTPVEVYYALETPIEEPITLPPIPTQKGDCSITVQTNTKPSKTEYQYYRGGK